MPPLLLMMKSVVFAPSDHRDDSKSRNEGKKGDVGVARNEPVESSWVVKRKRASESVPVLR